MVIKYVCDKIFYICYKYYYYYQCYYSFYFQDNEMKLIQIF